MALTKLSLEDVQHSADLRAAMDVLLAGHKAQSFTPPEPEPQHLVVEYHHEAGHDTRDVLATTFLTLVLGR